MVNIFLLASNCIQTSTCHVSTSINKSYEFVFLINFVVFYYNLYKGIHVCGIEKLIL
jgi:hypothetical protein